MKKNNTLILCLAIVSVLIISCGPSRQDAIKYNDQLLAIEQHLTPIQEGFFDQLDGHNIDSLKIMQQMFANQSKAALEECSKMGDFNHKKEFVDAATEYFKTINVLAEKEAKRITELMSKDSTQITEADYNEATELVGKLDTDYQAALKKVQVAQEVFAKEWKFEIKDEK